MTLSTARRALAVPLRSGDAGQIEALSFLGSVADCVAAIEGCPHGRTGNCQCLSHFSDDIRTSARKSYSQRSVRKKP
jgi:hypothetical protein